MNKKKDTSVRKFFIKLITEHKKEFFMIVSIATLGSVLSAIIPYIYGKLFDLAIIPSTKITFLLSLIGVWAVLGLISSFTQSKTSSLGSELGAKSSFEYEVHSYGHFLTLPVAFHKSVKTGEILNRISNASGNIEQFIESVSDLFPSFLFLIFSLVIMAFVKWELALALIFVLFVYGFFTFIYAKPIYESFRRLRKIYDREYGKIYDILYNVFLIKNFSLEKEEEKKIYSSLIEKNLKSRIEALNKSKKLQYVQGVCYTLGFVFILSIAIIFLRNGKITSGDFIMFFGYTSLAFSPFFRLSRFYEEYRKVKVAIERIINLNKKSPESMKHGDEIIKHFFGKIEFKNLDFGYEKNKRILKNINLKILPGESVAFVGESGVGKTTLSELVLGYYEPKKGKILFDGIDISRLKLNWLRNQIAIVPQEISIFDDTLINNFRKAKSDATKEEIIDVAKTANSHDFISKLSKKYDTLVGERGVKLSVGQKQRIAITMAFLKNPKILILDEPTASLDAKSERKVQEGVKKLMKKRTTLIIAHRFSTVRNADKIVVLEEGKIVEVGNHKELIRKRGKYYELYKLQRGIE